MEEVERMNTVVVRDPLQEQEKRIRGDPYAMDIDKGRNCYSCRKFGYLIRNCS